MSDFQPVILGSDINAYGMARAFHEAYGMTSTAFAHFQLSPTKYSRIIDVHLVPGFDRPAAFVQTLREYAQRMQRERPGVRLLLIPCGDTYANLLAGAREQLEPYYAFNTLRPELNRQLSLKSSFYQLCEKHGLAHPATISLDAEGVERGDYRNLPFNYPVAMKPADSDAWLSVNFPGRKKAFIIDDPQELETTIRRSYEAGYTGEMIIQDFIPGDDSRMRVLNAYVDQHHRVRMMCLGHPLLEDPTPEAVGNYAAIIPDYQEKVFGPIKAFLESIGYQGVANFDMKYDERDGRYKLFEINLRQGRSSYFVTLNGANLATYFVQDLVEDAPFDGRTLYARGSKLWMEIPKSIFTNYIEPGEDKSRGIDMIKRGDWGTTLEYRRDMSPLRWLMIRHMFSIYKKRYKQYFRRKGDLR
ncbi:ATP-grasp superfamily protein [Bifidobacterium actinocoloniiforme DSM 22766]|uniref:ATP-grasp superfamily protein n=1 Tax=Bifidobacterium actinocoloniiforme DSM 22766 TaxID=1437605 RepID=A0A086Z0Z2_9BIFI|nr:carboxylate--amine ligase [Bifidobacterium actinocoloniiforme]AKV56097.1 carboxylate--amine ligase [Bifidobacterium actinocoloniiforme DSM 22766]KFI40192.1 ATP-grasp superfamily protein [Bifidobacterium actinocoloniiforme DSM 22766]